MSLKLEREKKKRVDGAHLNIEKKELNCCTFTESGSNGFLKDIWEDRKEISNYLKRAVEANIFTYPKEIELNNNVYLLITKSFIPAQI